MLGGQVGGSSLGLGTVGGIESLQSGSGGGRGSSLGSCQSSGSLGDHDLGEAALKLQLECINFELGGDGFAGSTISLLSEGNSLLGHCISNLVLGVGSLVGSIGGSASGSSILLCALEVLGSKGSGIGNDEGGLRDDLFGDGGGGPAQLQRAVAFPFEELDADRVATLGKLDAASTLGISVKAVVVDDDCAIDVEHGAVIGSEVESVGAVLGDADETGEDERSVGRNLFVGNERCPVWAVGEVDVGNGGGLIGRQVPQSDGDSGGGDFLDLGKETVPDGGRVDGLAGSGISDAVKNIIELSLVVGGSNKSQNRNGSDGAKAECDK